jgi:hypothetical protein
MGKLLHPQNPDIEYFAMNNSIYEDSISIGDVNCFGLRTNEKYVHEYEFGINGDPPKKIRSYIVNDSEYEECDNCSGTGASPDDFEVDCEECDGIGHVWLGPVLQC